MGPTWRRLSAVAVPAGAVLLAGAAVALAAARTGSYLGSAASLPLVFGVSNDGKRMTNFEPTFIAKCTKRGSPDLSTPQIVTDAGRNVAINHGVFSARGVNGKVSNGPHHVIATGTDMVSGRFVSSHTAKGTYSVRLTFNRSAPVPYPGYHCTTGTLKWTAKHV